jgi:putative solute:sodium symporter small subunit
MTTDERRRRYWRTNLWILTVLLAVWFLFSCVFSIFLVEFLNRFQFAGFPLGFWIAQQGSILVFVVLILAYAWAMKRVDRKFNVDSRQEER